MRRKLSQLSTEWECTSLTQENLVPTGQTTNSSAFKSIGGVPFLLYRTMSDMSVSRRRPRSLSTNEDAKDPMSGFIETVSWVLGTLEKDSQFFQQNPPRFLPHLDHSEIEIGKVLGEGEFGIVYEVKEFKVSEMCHCPVCLCEEEEDEVNPPIDKLVITSMPPEKESSAHGLGKPESTGSRVSFADIAITIEDTEFDSQRSQSDQESSDDVDVDDVPDDFEIREERGFLRAHCKRGGLARYAVKQVRDKVADAMKEDAAIDLATEAKFLASLSHPNIIKLRAIVGVPGHPDFLMVMDRLYSTLSQAMVIWKRDDQRYRGTFGFGRRRTDLEHLRIDRMIALYDIARALKYLHSHK